MTSTSTRDRVLRSLALQGADAEWIETTSRDVADRVGVSQQTASRILLELDAADHIDRQLCRRSQLVRLTPAGVSDLWKEYASYRDVFAPEVPVP